MVIIFIRPYLEHDSSHGSQSGFQLCGTSSHTRALGSTWGSIPLPHGIPCAGTALPSCPWWCVCSKGSSYTGFWTELWVRHKWNPQLPIYLVAICSSANRDFCWVIDDGVLRMATSLFGWYGQALLFLAEHKAGKYLAGRCLCILINQCFFCYFSWKQIEPCALGWLWQWRAIPQQSPQFTP